MLVLTRKVGEIVRVEMPDGTTMMVHFLDVNRGQMKIGFDAPKSVSIIREEIYDKHPRKL